MQRLVDLIVIIVIVLLGLSFAMLNKDVVQLNYYFGSVTTPLSLLLTVVLIVGAVLGVLSTIGIVVRQRAEIARLRRRTRMERKAISERSKLPVSTTT
ncbi:MAG: LapA family protein [Nitrococcus sp.]|nr:LapA family protein [Nitrococcus sp.]